MTHHERELRRLVGDFAAGRTGLDRFHPEFIDRWTRLPAGALSAGSRGSWNEIYSLVLRTIPGTPGGPEGAQGVLGPEELRQRLRRHPLLAGAP